MHPFPSWIHHKEKEAFVIHSMEEYEALKKDGWGWASEVFPQEAQKPETYVEHMAKWESKEEKAEQPKRKRQKAAK